MSLGRRPGMAVWKQTQNRKNIRKGQWLIWFVNPKACKSILRLRNKAWLKAGWGSFHCRHINKIFPDTSEFSDLTHEVKTIIIYWWLDVVREEAPFYHKAVTVTLVWHIEQGHSEDFGSIQRLWAVMSLYYFLVTFVLFRQFLSLWE